MDDPSIGDSVYELQATANSERQRVGHAALDEETTLVLHTDSQLVVSTYSTS